MENFYDHHDPQKEENDKTDPNNCGPSSVTSCLGKILERVMTKKLVIFLETNFILVNFQSGFRPRRRTADNLYFLAQKIKESLKIITPDIINIFFNFQKKSMYIKNVCW